MAGPWEDYAGPTSGGPWMDYSGGSSAAPQKPSATPPIVGTPRAAPEQPNVFGQALGGILEPLAAMGSSFVAKPVSEVAGLAALAREAVSPTGGDPRAFQQDVQQSMTYEPKTAAGQSMANPLNFIPALLGQLVQGAGNWAGGIVAPPGSSPAREAVGRGVTEAVQQAPGFIGAKGVPVAAEAAGPALRAGAERTMSSALKPDLASRRTGKAEKAVGTMLDEGINVTKGGAEELRTRIAGLNDRVANLIEQSPAVVNKEAVASRLQEKIKELELQATPNADLAAIQRNLLEFMDHPLAPKKVPATSKVVNSAILDESGKPFTKVETTPASGTDTIPVQTAQKMKQGTYKALGDKAYGEIKSADIEGQKTLARGLKEEIGNLIPEVRPLNAQESKLLGALSLTERRVLQEANNNLLGLGWLMLSPVHLAGWMADRSGLFKSLVARMMNKSSEWTPPVGRALGPPLGMAVDTQAQGIQPPPGAP